MRHALSPAEARLWQAIRAGKLGVQFRRQVVLADRYIADFLAQEARLVVEVDGAQHAHTRSADAKRDRVLLKLGYRTQRVASPLGKRRASANRAEDIGASTSCFITRVLIRSAVKDPAHVSQAPEFPVPKDWHDVAKSGLVHAVALARLALLQVLSGFENGRNPRARLLSEVERLGHTPSPA